MRTSLKPSYLFLLFFFGFASGCSGGKTMILESRSPAQALTMDGLADDWADALKPIEGERFSMGMQNDDNFLYVLLVSSDQSVVNQIMRHGLTLWFDAEGGSAETFGIKFPLGLSASHRDGGSSTPLEPPRTPEARQQRFQASLQEFEVVGGESIRLNIAEAPGIEAHATLQYGTLTYELQVPLQQSDLYSYAVGALPGTAIGIGLASFVPERDGVRGRRPGGVGGPPSGGGSIGGRGGVTPPGGGRPGRFQQNVSLEVWLSVHLAQ